jgi:hypothetical protein
MLLQRKIWRVQVLVKLEMDSLAKSGYIGGDD